MLVVMLGMFGLLVAQLSSSPALSWDEGWTLTVADNWVQRGYYGRLLNDQPNSPALAAAFPSVASVALSFKLFGVGVWQGRLPAVCYMLGAIFWLYLLARWLYSETIARASLLIAVLMTPHLATQPLYMGRQVLAEPIMLFFLLAGYVALGASLRQPRWAVLMILAWGIGLASKSQPLPFWFVSLLLPLVVSLWARRWRAAALLGAGIAGSLLIMLSFGPLQNLLLTGRTQPAEPLVGLYGATALVLARKPRLFALLLACLLGLPTLFGLLYALRQWFRLPNNTARAVDLELLRMAVWAFSGSWFAWYLLLSVGWARYLFPALFVGNLFVAALLHALTDGYRPTLVLNRCAQAIRSLLVKRRFSRQTAADLVVSISVPAVVVIMMLVSIQQISQIFTVHNNPTAQDVTQFLNSNTPPGAVIESYDSEIFFLLERPYHYPPDQTNVEMIVRGDLGQSVAQSYQPLAADPDFLVVGVFSRAAKVYDEVLKSNAFRVLKSYRGYTVYERVR